MLEKSSVIVEVCRALADGAVNQAVSIAKRDYLFAPEPIGKRKYGLVESARLFIQDGFIDADREASFRQWRMGASVILIRAGELTI